MAPRIRNPVCKGVSVVQPPSSERDEGYAAGLRAAGPAAQGAEAGLELEPEEGVVAAASTAEPEARIRVELLEEVPPAALAAARRLSDETGHALLVRVVGQPRVELQALNNALMDLYRERSSIPAYSLLFELNMRPFSLIAARILRLTNSRADLGDIIQEAFLAIYRYPSRFCPDKPNAFRNWSYSIIRNTVYRHLNADAREAVPVDFVHDILADERSAGPDRRTEDAEADENCTRVYGLLLVLYARIYEQDLKPRDRLALQLVEVDGLAYRDAADVIGCKLENFKMIVCRARKKIFASLVCALGSRRS